MDDFFKMVDQWMLQNKKQHRYYDSDELKGCIYLLENGWSIIEYRPVPNTNSTEVWFNLGETTQSIKLLFSDQVRWAGYLESRQVAKNSDNSI
jgi:hypothetical protein